MGPTTFCHRLAQGCKEDFNGLPGLCIIEVRTSFSFDRRIFSAIIVLQERTRKRILLPSIAMTPANSLNSASPRKMTMADSGTALVSNTVGSLLFVWII